MHFIHARQEETAAVKAQPWILQDVLKEKYKYNEMHITDWAVKTRQTVPGDMITNAGSFWPAQTNKTLFNQDV